VGRTDYWCDWCQRLLFCKTYSRRFEILVQLLAVVVVGAYSVLVTWLIMKTLKAVGPVRVSAEEEARGLDEEEAYHLTQ
jgi:ammonia channel protein AmtB